MATHTLTADTLISTLTLADGDTIELAGFNIIWDADTRTTGATITNGGAAAHFECRNGGGVKLNASLPSNVLPWVDPSNPLPEANYEAGLTANASFEFQLNGNFGLGGGDASLPTDTRAGNFWARVASSGAVDSLTFDRDIPLHPGDIIFNLTVYNGLQFCEVTAFDALTNTATLSPSPSRRDSGDYWAIGSGGVLVNSLTSYAGAIISANCSAGTLCIKSNGVGASANASVFGKRVSFYGHSTIASGAHPFSEGAAASIDELAAARVYWSAQNNSTRTQVGGLRVGSFVSTALSDLGENKLCADCFFGDGVAIWPYQNNFGGNAIISFENVVFRVIPKVTSKYAMLIFSGCLDSNGNHLDCILETAGTISRARDSILAPCFFHAPATAAAVTWRYTDRTVPSGATLRLRCAWLREGDAATRASVAVTDLATWLPQLWPLGAEALASVEFTGGTADWRQELLAWRNTGTEAVTVRVWECVTGTTAGGYLKVEEVKGGAL